MLVPVWTLLFQGTELATSELRFGCRLPSDFRKTIMLPGPRHLLKICLEAVEIEKCLHRKNHAP